MAQVKKGYLISCFVLVEFNTKLVLCQISLHHPFHVALSSPISRTGCLRIKGLSDWPRFSSGHVWPLWLSTQQRALQTLAGKQLCPPPYLGQSTPQLSSMASRQGRRQARSCSRHAYQAVGSPPSLLLFTLRAKLSYISSFEEVEPSHRMTPGKHVKFI